MIITIINVVFSFFVVVVVFCSYYHQHMLQKRSKENVNTNLQFIIYNREQKHIAAIASNHKYGWKKYKNTIRNRWEEHNVVGAKTEMCQSTAQKKYTIRFGWCNRNPFIFGAPNMKIMRKRAISRARLHKWQSFCSYTYA